MSRLRPHERPTQEVPAVHTCRGRQLAEQLLAFERGLPLGEGATLVPRNVWMDWLKVAVEATEEP